MTSPFPPGSAVAAYLRDSGGDEQEQSIESQERAIRSWCASQGLALSVIFQDTASGTSTAGRTGFSAMMDHFSRKERPLEAGVILWSFSRFSRDLEDSQFYKAELRRRGFLIHSMTDNVPDGLDGRLIESILEWKDAKFSADLSVHVKRGMRDMVLQNGGVPGTPPRGFKREPVEIGKHRDGSKRIVHRWVPDEDTWQTCKRAWELRLAGASYRRIMDELPGLYRSVSCYRTFFSNPIYKGVLRFGELVVEDYAPAMVSAVEWERVQAMFRGSIRHGSGGRALDHPRRRASSFALSGLVHCGLCGAPLGGGSTKSPKRKAVFYYSCTGKRNRRDCTARNIPKDVLEGAVIAEMKRHVLTVENLEEAQAGMDEAAARKELTDLKRERGKRKAVVGRLVNALAYVEFSEALSEKLRSTEAEIRELERKIMIAEEARVSQRKLSREEIAELVGKALEDLKTNDPVELRRVLGNFIGRIDVVREEKRVAGTIYYCLRMKGAPNLSPLHTQTFAIKIKLRHHPVIRIQPGLPRLDPSFTDQLS